MHNLVIVLDGNAGCVPKPASTASPRFWASFGDVRDTQPVISLLESAKFDTAQVKAEK